MNDEDVTVKKSKSIELIKDALSKAELEIDKACKDSELRDVEGYLSLWEIMDIVKEIFYKHGITVLKATDNLGILHESGEWIIVGKKTFKELSSSFIPFLTCSFVKNIIDKEIKNE